MARETLVGQNLNWVGALATSTTIAQGHLTWTTLSAPSWLPDECRQVQSSPGHLHVSNSAHRRVSLFEESFGSFIPLGLQFVYKPSPGFVTKEFYRKQPQGLSAINLRDKFVGPEVNILAEHIEDLYAVVGNQAVARGGKEQQCANADGLCNRRYAVLL